MALKGRRPGILTGGISTDAGRDDNVASLFPPTHNWTESVFSVPAALPIENTILSEQAYVELSAGESTSISRLEGTCDSDEPLPSD